MKPVDGDVTTDFFERRPLALIELLKDADIEDRPEMEKKIHVHGAVDLATIVGDPIRAPEAGHAFGWCAFRPMPALYWDETPEIHGAPFEFRNYFYDTFGGVIIVRSLDGKRVHVITHTYKNQIFNKGIYVFGGTCEQKKDARFPIHAIHTEPKRVVAGDVVGFVGNAGFSTGPHVHWEIHRGNAWNWWDRRINPERWEYGI